MKKYKVKAELTQNGTTTTYEDDVFFTDMIPSVLNSKTLSANTTEANKLEELTGGVILYDENINKENDNIAVNKNKVHIAALNKDGTVEITGVSGHVGSICMTTKTNALSYDELKNNCTYYDPATVLFDKKNYNSVEYIRDFAIDFDLKGYGYAEDVEGVNNNYSRYYIDSTEIDDTYASLSGRHSNIFKEDSKKTEVKDFYNIISALRDLKYEHKNIRKLYVYREEYSTTRIYEYQNPGTVSKSNNIYEDDNYIYVFCNIYYVYPKSYSRGTGEPSVHAEYTQIYTEPDEFIESLNPFCQYNTYLDAIPGKTTDLLYKNIIVRIDKKDFSEELIEIPNRISTQTDTIINSSILENEPILKGYQEYYAGSTEEIYSDVGMPGFGVSYAVGKYANIPLSTYLIAVDDNYYYFNVLEGCISADSYNSYLYKVDKTTFDVINAGLLANNIATINSINLNHNTLKTFREKIGNNIFSNSVICGATDTGSTIYNAEAEYQSFTTVDGLENYNKNYMRDGGINAGAYIYYPGICSISNFNFDINAEDTLKITFEAGDFDAD